MELKNLPAISEALLQKMADDRYSKNILENTRWVLSHFNDYCQKHSLSVVTLDTAQTFVKECFGFEIMYPQIPLHSVLRRPLLILFEFHEYGGYAKTHKKPRTIKVLPSFEALYCEYRSYVNHLEINRTSKVRRMLIFSRFIAFLGESGISDLSGCQMTYAYDFVNSFSGYAPATIRGYKTVTRLLFDWLHENKNLPFSGRQILPVIPDSSRSSLISVYSKEEISKILSDIDNSTEHGKFVYSTLCLLAYLGMRAGDVVGLKFSNIDWNNNCIHFNQYKTGNPLTLPIPEEVKNALIDYIKNARHESDDKEHIFITMYAPYTAYKNGSVLCGIVSKCMADSGISTEGRHHGPHSLRHSLATGLLKENIPVSEISDILGHASTLTTETYLSVDTTHLKELSLEVPYEKE